MKTRWIAEADQKTDRVDAKKLAQLLRVDMVAERYVPPDEFRKGRALARDLPTQFTFHTFREWITHELDADLSQQWSVPTNGVGIPDSYVLAAD